MGKATLDENAPDFVGRHEDRECCSIKIAFETKGKTRGGGAGSVEGHVKALLAELWRRGKRLARQKRQMNG